MSGLLGDRVIENRGWTVRCDRCRKPGATFARLILCGACVRELKARVPKKRTE